VGEFVDAPKTSVIYGCAYTDLRSANCDADDTELLDNQHSFRKESSASPSGIPFMMVLVALILQSKLQEVNDVDMDLFSVAHVMHVPAAWCQV
jgi:hypothetical protein